MTVAGTTLRADEPFFVLATQNPIEMEGTYPLPEAQLDRLPLQSRRWIPVSGRLHDILGERLARHIEAGKAANGQQ